VAVITAEGQVYTWGAGDYGMLGHGSKQSVTQPKLVQALSGLTCAQVSCGRTHTAFITSSVTGPNNPLSNEGGLTYIRIPNTFTRLHPSFVQPDKGKSTIVHNDSHDGVCDNGHGYGYGNKVEAPTADNYLTCGDFYTCGQGTVGQLGLGDDCKGGAGITTPRRVAFFAHNGLRVASVSCGLHHTLAVAVPSHSLRTFCTQVFSFGWGEHGRLGVGDEEARRTPTEVIFPEPFHATEVSAGEQHSIAAGGGTCYSWGNNEFGQLGLGSPSVTPSSLSPVKLPLPGGVHVRTCKAGGRHSAAVTWCNRLLTWGWGEEGQLATGAETNVSLPRLCRIPKFNGQSSGVIADVALGHCHTVVLVTNPSYTAELPPPVETNESEPPQSTPAPAPDPVLDQPAPVAAPAPVSPLLSPPPSSLTAESLPIDCRSTSTSTSPSQTTVGSGSENSLALSPAFFVTTQITQPPRRHSQHSLSISVSTCATPTPSGLPTSSSIPAEQLAIPSSQSVGSTSVSLLGTRIALVESDGAGNLRDAGGSASESGEASQQAEAAVSAADAADTCRPKPVVSLRDILEAREMRR